MKSIETNIEYLNPFEGFPSEGITDLKDLSEEEIKKLTSQVGSCFFKVLEKYCPEEEYDHIENCDSSIYTFVNKPKRNTFGMFFEDGEKGSSEEDKVFYCSRDDDKFVFSSTNKSNKIEILADAIFILENLKKDIEENWIVEEDI